MGKGVFTKTPLAKDDRLAVFGGYVMTLAEEEQLPEQIRDYAHQIDDDLVLGIKRVEDIQPVDYFNHNCSPNAGFRGQIMLVAMRDVERDEEITFDYAMVLSDAGSAEPYTLNCACGSDTCRKTVTDSDWKLLELQEKYNGYFQEYLQRKITKNKHI